MDSEWKGSGLSFVSFSPDLSPAAFTIPSEFPGLLVLHAPPEVESGVLQWQPF